MSAYKHPKIDRRKCKLTAPKVFISYSWTNPEHENWVLELATGLRQSGIDAILDKWDLREGHDAYAFMEQMVSDDNISKVVIVSDKAYAEKSNTRKGGAGTEAQIISSEIYAKRDQNKFAVVVTEFSEAGEPYVPIYYQARIFIDFSDASKFTDSFDNLLRWIADKPIHKKPELGQLPQYIAEPDAAVVLATSAAQRRALAGIKGNEAYAFPATKEYMEQLAEELEKFRLPKDFDLLSDDVMNNLQSFIPYRDEFLEVVRAIAGYTEDDRYGDLVHGFFEKVFRYYRSPEGQGVYREIDFDNFKFLVHELFLHVGAMLISERRFSFFGVLLEKLYYCEDSARRGNNPIKTFVKFRCYLRLFEYRNQQLKLNRFSLVADMIRDRCGGTGTPFNNIMQVDFLLFIRSSLSYEDRFNRWYPDTLVFSDRVINGFELFQRSRSAAFFETIRPLLGGVAKGDLEKLVESYNVYRQDLPRDGFSSISPANLMGLGNLCTIP